MSNTPVSTDLSPEDVAAALKQARARGLPDGWTVKLDKRRRRKWICKANGRSCDSIPKALKISVEAGLLPADFPLDAPVQKKISKNTNKKNKPGTHNKKNKKSGGVGAPPKASKKRPATTTPLPAAPKPKKLAAIIPVDDYNDEDPEIRLSPEPKPPSPPPSPPPEPEVDPGPDSDPETSFHFTKDECSTKPTTVHWDPNSAEGCKVGWKIRLWCKVKNDWRDGRVVRYDPYTHKHKVQYFGSPRKIDNADKFNCAWLRLVDEVTQLGTRFIWAHVKGFAWWPAQVMDCDPPAHGGKIIQREGYVFVNFFGSDQVATLRDTLECVRPFDGGKVDAFILKNKKKRNAKAVQLANEEQALTREARNEASRYYAKKAFEHHNRKAMNLLGKRVEVFRPDVNYPYGETVVGTVRKYSTTNKKWLLSYSDSRYAPSWINLKAKEFNYKLLDKKLPIQPKDRDLVPFMVGYENAIDFNSGDNDDEQREELSKLLFSCCRGCLEPLKGKRETPILKCHSCHGSFHPDCLDSPIADKTAQRILDEGKKWNCPRCTQCKGCLQHDIAFGSHVQSPPATLTLEPADQLHLCSTCTTAYEQERFCVNCAHTWNDVLYQKIMRRFRWKGKRKPTGKKRGRKRKHVEPEPDCDSENGIEDQTPEQIEVDLEEHSIEPSWFYPESEVWGFNEGAMLICDGCNLWVHAGCAKLSRDEYEEASAGDHPIYSKEFLCRTCCKRRCKKLIEALQKEDNMDLFAIPVTEQVAPNYHDVIKNPMDLQTMAQRAAQDDYLNYAWVREAFELMVLNALTFNSHYSKFWNEARRFYHESLRRVFAVHGKAAPAGKYAEAVKDNFLSAKRAKQMEEERVQEDETTEKKDLVAGSEVAVINLPPLSEPADMPSCLPFTEVKLKSLDAYYLAWMDSCFTCGSSGASDTMLFCVDCGEAFHSFCVNAPIHSMLKSSVAGWRCPNCKVCEITGEVPKDETKMLFCEMCDRAFSLDLLDPPLKSAPDGLWICGQCVDCKSCGNAAEKKGASVKHWSRDPIKCYRCGGCEGLIERTNKPPKCVVCSKYWRESDDNLAECSTCNSRVHSTCDNRAKEYLKLRLAWDNEGNAHNPGDTENVKSGSSEPKYECPSCRKKNGGDTSFGKVLRKQLHDQAWLVILQGTLAPHANYTFVELHDKLSQEIDWRMRNMWRDDYRVVIKEGLRLLGKAREKMGSTKAINDKFSHGSLELPSWMGHRAARFIRRSKRPGWDVEGFPKKDVEALVSMAISAASFMKVACRAMGINTKKNVKCYQKMVKMLKPPDSCGLNDLPVDTVRTDGNRHIIQEKEWKSTFEPQVQQAMPSLSMKYGQNSNGTITEGGCYSTGLGLSTAGDSKYVIATPMRGWNSMIPDNDRVNEWKDPRACSLCRTCGDDDAGLPPQDNPSRALAHQTFFDQAESESEKPNVARVGRLLPMSGGMWVHASCALWSSEVWEASGGVVHSMDKARSRGSQLKCFGCGRPGATVGCSKANCSSNYHFPCAKACGAVFTSNQSMFCKLHASHAVDLAQMASFEQMRPLSFDNQIAADGDQIDECFEKDSYLRIGSLTVHSLGAIDEKLDGFHSENYITPPGYIATRIFWSICKPKTRTVYILKIENVQGNAVFSATPGDDPGAEVRGRSADKVYKALLKLVHIANRDHFSHGDMFSKLPMLRNFEKRAYGLNGAQFFGFGINSIRRALETLPGVEAVVTPLSKDSPSYKFCFVQPEMDLVMDLQRKRAAVAAEKALENPSGCARTEGHHAVLRSGGSGRITRALVKSAGGDAQTDASGKKSVQEETQADRDTNQRKYKEMKSVPLEDRLAALRSHIHGWGLFTKVDIKKHGMIIEYMGEVVRQCIADKREKGYEESGIGSCYMFRLDLQRIVDATMIGCMARFMNHCCRPNAYAKVINVDTENGADKKIVVFANRDIAAGEEVTYDYKFPVEDGSLKCTCGAPNCIGRMN